MRSCLGQLKSLLFFNSQQVMSSCVIQGFPKRPALILYASQTRNVTQKILHKDVINRDKQQQMAVKPEIQEEADESSHQDMPIAMANPYERPYRKCIVCEHNIEVNYQNIRLLSQFVSPYTGMIYGRQHTGLCQYMQRRVGQLIKRARFFGLMPYMYKDQRFLHDPKLFDPFAPRKSK